MSPLGPYTTQEYRMSVAGRPLAAVPQEHLLLLHRHWIWANHTSRWTDRAMAADAEARGRPLELEDGIELADEAWAAMYVWYGLLWSVIEGLRDRGVTFGDPLENDIDEIADGLRLCRNAVFHVSRKRYWDKRLHGPMT